LWIKELKLAIINDDLKTLDKLLSSIPEFDNLEDAKLAQNLIKEASLSLMEKRDKTRAIMQNLKNGKKFLENDRVKNIHQYFDKSL